MRSGAPGDSCGLDSRPPSIITSPSRYTHPSLCHITTCALCVPEISWGEKNAVSGVPESLRFPHRVKAPLPALPFQRTNCKCRYEEMPPESTGFSPTQTKVERLPELQTLSNPIPELAWNSFLQACLQGQTGPSWRQPLCV